MTHIALRYDGDGAFTAHGSFAKRCDAELVIGEILPWQRVEIRSGESHRHYFAAINEAWANLPETLADEFSNPTHLRKYALIRAGYCTVKKIICKTNWDAMEACAMMRDMDTYALFEVSANVLTVWRAKSQKVKVMGKKEFQESKEKVLHILSNLVGGDVAANAEEAA